VAGAGGVHATHGHGFYHVEPKFGYILPPSLSLMPSSCHPLSPLQPSHDLSSSLHPSPVTSLLEKPNGRPHPFLTFF
jgi:hypothetical protein